MESLTTGANVEVRISRVAKRMPRSAHDVNYALGYVVSGACVLRYDNEAGKGDHRHIDATKTAYALTAPDALVADFWKDMDNWRPK